MKLPGAIITFYIKGKKKNTEKMLTSMKVITLAAGEGTRLRPLTLNNPKCLVELFGKSILQWQIDTFNYFQIKNIIIVKGYLEKKINFPNITYYINEKFSTSPVCCFFNSS